jgi:hypothetical protein
MKKLNLISIFTLCLFAPVLAQADAFEDAVKDANIEIDKAKAVNYEWRDSRKLIKQAEKLNKEGNNDKAMKLVATAKEQGQIAVAQAELQAGTAGPR